MGKKTYIPWQSTIYPAAIAVGFVIGCTAYFLLPFEPSVTAASYLSIAALLLAIICHKKEPLLIASILLLSSSVALTYTTIRVQNMNTTFISEQDSGKRIWLSGLIETIHIDGKRAKLLLNDLKFYDLQGSKPQKVRVTVSKNRLKDLKAGDWVATQALLYRPTPLNFEGDFDFMRYSYLKGIGAWGYVRGDFYKTAPLMEDKNLLEHTLFNIRTNLAARIKNQSSDTSGGVMIALLTGIKDFIPKEVQEAFRNTGLAHILAISGMHLALIAGMVFFVSRRIIGCTPQITLRMSSKKLAAIIAFVFSFAYMLLAGATLPTVRAFIMLSLLFLAVWLERVRLGLRVLSFAVVIVLLLWPEMVISPSFQMSFIAVLFLIIGAEKEKTATKEEGVFTSKGYIKTVLMSSFVAGMATLPIAAWHFNIVSFSGILLNLGAIPLTGFWIMPSGLLALLATPFHLETPFLWVMDAGVAYLIDISLWGQKLSLSGLKVSSSIWFSLTIGTSLLLLSVFIKQKVWRYGTATGGVLLCLNAFYLPQEESYDMFILRGGETVLIHTGKEFSIAKQSGSRDELRILNRLESEMNINKKTPTSTASCDHQGCVYQIKEQSIFLPAKEYVTQTEDCRLSNYILSDKTLSKNCEPIVTFPKESASSYITFLSNGEIEVKHFMPTKGDKRVWQGISIDENAGKH